MCTDFVKEVSEKCVGEQHCYYSGNFDLLCGCCLIPSDAFHLGYCGADLKALCTEAALHALRRRYPQIYLSSEKLQVSN